mmetsp:Transcript_2120/g.8203  ORF Transcript_2120/g.8203 Transcript_2120/m.8203 type:complete len:275 (+) Transcript_2120:248-1072(+)
MATAMYAAPTAPTTLFDYAPGAPAVTLGPPPPPRVVPAAADVRRAAHCCVFTGVPMSPVVAEYGQQNPGDHAAALSCCYGAAYGASTPSSSSFTGVDASSAAITFPAACVWLDLRNRKSSGQLKRSSRAAHGAGLEDLFDAKRRRSGPLEVDDGECSDDDRRDPLDASQRGGFFETTTTTSSHRNGGVAHYDAAASSSSSSRPHRRHAGDPRDLGVASMMPLARTTARGDHRDGFRRRRRDVRFFSCVPVLCVGLLRRRWSKKLVCGGLVRRRA